MTPATPTGTSCVRTAPLGPLFIATHDWSHTTKRLELVVVVVVVVAVVVVVVVVVAIVVVAIVVRLESVASSMLRFFFWGGGYFFLFVFVRFERKLLNDVWRILLIKCRILNSGHLVIMIMIMNVVTKTYDCYCCCYCCCCCCYFGPKINEWNENSVQKSSSSALPPPPLVSFLNIFYNIFFNFSLHVSSASSLTRSSLPVFETWLV